MEQESLRAEAELLDTVITNRGGASPGSSEGNPLFC